MAKKPALGRGLDALLKAQQAPAVGGAEAESVITISVDALSPSEHQARKQFDTDSLDQLANSIREHGLLQPLVIRKRTGGGYELIAGERRWRAAQQAEVSEVPAVVREVSDEESMILGLVENLQRDDLNPIDESEAFIRLSSAFDLKHTEIADAIGRSRSYVSNSMRLLNLVPEVADLVREGRLEAGHARALITVPQHQQLSLAMRIVDSGMSVRDTEKLVGQLKEPGKKTKPDPAPDADIQRLEQQLSDTLGAKVTIRHKSDGPHVGRGEMRIRYSSLDELDGILERLKNS